MPKMTRLQLRAELFRIKGLIHNALLDEAFKNGTESEFYKEIHAIWKEMNENQYEI